MQRSSTPWIFLPSTPTKGQFDTQQKCATTRLGLSTLPNRIYVSIILFIQGHWHGIQSPADTGPSSSSPLQFMFLSRFPLLSPKSSIRTIGHWQLCSCGHTSITGHASIIIGLTNSGAAVQGILAVILSHVWASSLEPVDHLMVPLCTGGVETSRVPGFYIIEMAAAGRAVAQRGARADSVSPLCY